MNKRERSEVLYNELTAEGYTLPEGRTLRAVFIERAVNELDMTEKGAATYYINAKNKAAGKPIQSYYTPKTQRRQIGRGPEEGYDARWSIAAVEDNTVVDVQVYATEEKARSAFKQMNKQNQARCLVVPGIASVGEATTASGEIVHEADKPTEEELTAEEMGISVAELRKMREEENQD